MLEISEGLIYSCAYLPSKNESTKKKAILTLNSRNHRTLKKFVNIYNTDTSSAKAEARTFFLQHIVALIPPSPECSLLQKIKQAYWNIAFEYLWEKKFPRKCVVTNPAINHLTDQFFEKLNNQINPLPM